MLGNLPSCPGCGRVHYPRIAHAPTMAATALNDAMAGLSITAECQAISIQHGAGRSGGVAGIVGGHGLQALNIRGRSQNRKLCKPCPGGCIDMWENAVAEEGANRL